MLKESVSKISKKKIISQFPNCKPHSTRKSYPLVYLLLDLFLIIPVATITNEIVLYAVSIMKNRMHCMREGNH